MIRPSAMPDAAHPVVFVHIPKCSGTALENYVLSQGALSEQSRAFTGLGVDGRPETVAQYFKRESARSPFLFGHFSYGDIEHCCPPALRCTFLRDPVGRTISHYKSWHDPRNFQPGDHHYAAASPALRAALEFAQKASFEEFVCSDDPIIRSGALGNQQTVYLSTYKGEDMEGHLDSAMENLSATDFFGITEAFADSIDLFRQWFTDFGPYAIGAEGENRSASPGGAITEQAREIVESQVAYDRRLYRFAVELFEARLGRPLSAQPTARAASPDSSVLARTLVENEQLRIRAAQLEHEVERFAAAEAAQTMDSAGTVADQRDAELGLLQAQVAHLQASYSELLQLYEQITRSRSWRLMAALQACWGRLRG